MVAEQYTGQIFLYIRRKVVQRQLIYISIPNINIFFLLQVIYPAVCKETGDAWVWFQGR